MNQITTILILVAACSAPTLAQQPLTVEAAVPGREVTIDWVSWEDALVLSETEPQKLLLYIHTSWCSWCKRMDANTFNQPEVADYVNASFYPVKFDAEQQQQLEYKGKVYEFVKNSKHGYHELAAELLKGRMSYPSVVFMDEEMEVIQSIIGFKTRDEFMKILAYFGENHYMKTPWSTFKKEYQPQLIKDRE
ncbi:MAG: DUF255 domain-containing protein [Bacteroidetes bacterium]|jgi:thioredoxin-related protein|nr:DUF255 domain-containing protein [Bacteroidota bacterium]